MDIIYITLLNMSTTSGLLFKYMGIISLQGMLCYKFLYDYLCQMLFNQLNILILGSEDALIRVKSLIRL